MYTKIIMLTKVSRSIKNNLILLVSTAVQGNMRTDTNSYETDFPYYLQMSVENNTSSYYLYTLPHGPSVTKNRFR